MNKYKQKRLRELNAKWYNKLRLSVYARDEFTCQMCDKKGCKLNAHHIVPYSKSKWLRFNRKNLITLCTKCHDSIFGIEQEYIDVFKRIVLLNERRSKRKWQQLIQ